MVKFSELNAKDIDKMFHEKIEEGLSKGLPYSIAAKMANRYIYKLWEKEKYPNESDCESDEHL